MVNEIDQDGQVVHLTTLDASIDDEIDEMEQQKRQKFASHAVERAESDKPEQRNVSSEPTPTPNDTPAPEIVSAETNALLNEKIEAAVTEFTKLAGAEEAARLKTFLEQPGVLSPAPEGSEAPSALVLGSSNDKAYRTSLHVFFNSHFQLTTDSVEPAAGGDGKRCDEEGLEETTSVHKGAPQARKGKERRG